MRALEVGIVSERVDRNAMLIVNSLEWYSKSLCILLGSLERKDVGVETEEIAVKAKLVRREARAPWDER